MGLRVACSEFFLFGVTGVSASTSFYDIAVVSGFKNDGIMGFSPGLISQWKRAICMIGLKKGVVALYDHDPQWEKAAEESILKLKGILGPFALDIQHVGSTSIKSIKAKPIIDLAVAVKDLDEIRGLAPQLGREGFIHRPQNDGDWQVYFQCEDALTGMRTHHIHVVEAGGTRWKDYIRFRDYLNNHPSAAKAYENLKLELMARHPGDRLSYTDGKAEFIGYVLRKAQIYAFRNKVVDVTIDRPVGTVHPKHETLFYPINYGYLEDEIAPDGEGLDVYILGVDTPLESFSGRIIAAVHRSNDIEDKLVAATEGFKATAAEIAEAVRFQEQFYISSVEVYDEEQGNFNS